MRHAWPVVLAIACGDNRGVAPPDAPAFAIDGQCRGRPDAPSVLVFSAENLWSHPANPVAQQALLDMCETRGLHVVASRDPLILDERVLRDIDVVVFALTSGPVLDDRARAHLEPWLRGGGGFVGLHTPDATEQQWPFFVELIGATFKTHAPGTWAADITIEDASHPIVAGLPPRMAVVDEYHVFNERPETTEMTMLLAVDESTLAADYPADMRVGYHPIAWAHELLGGRMFFTCTGHDPIMYAEDWYLDLLANAIQWAAGG